MYNCRETRNYFFLRIRATVYTVMFILVIIFLLVLSVFGNSLNIFIAEHVPFLRNMADWLIRARNIITPIVYAGVDGHFLGVFCICGCVQRIFQYVRKSDNDHVDYDVDVFLHVLHFDRWRAEHLVRGKD